MKRNKLIAWGVLIVWLIVIFAFSNQAHSGTVTFNILESIFKETSSDVIKVINFFWRKSAHIIEYLVLTLLVVNIFKRYNNNWKVILIGSGVITFGLSMLDELHQSFVPGRSAMFSDCLIDFIGIFIALVITFVLFKRKSV